jgi:hypothetical protein
MNLIQLELIEEDKIEVLERKLFKMQETLDVTRRSLFARFNELEKIVLEMQKKPDGI